MPVTINIGGCCCPGGGSGSGDGALYFTVTCLDAGICGGTGAQFTCPESQLPNTWCISDFGTTNASSRCAYLFDSTNLQAIGEVCTGICDYGMASYANPDVTVGNCPGSYQLAMYRICAGDAPLFFVGGGTTAPDNGIVLAATIINADSSLANAAWFIAADDFDCNGSNILVLIGTENSTNEDWAASIEIHPCARRCDYLGDTDSCNECP